MKPRTSSLRRKGYLRFSPLPHLRTGFCEDLTDPKPSPGGKREGRPRRLAYVLNRDAKFSASVWKPSTSVTTFYDDLYVLVWACLLLTGSPTAAGHFTPGRYAQKLFSAAREQGQTFGVKFPLNYEALRSLGVDTGPEVDLTLTRLGPKRNMGQQLKIQ